MFQGTQKSQFYFSRDHCCEVMVKNMQKSIFSMHWAITGSAELVIQRRLWIHIPVSEFRDGGSVNSDTLSLFWISALTETIRHTTRYVQELSLMFAKDLSVQINFLSVQIL